MTLVTYLLTYSPRKECCVYRLLWKLEGEYRNVICERTTSSVRRCLRMRVANVIARPVAVRHGSREGGRPAHGCRLKSRRQRTAKSTKNQRASHLSCRQTTTDRIKRHARDAVACTGPLWTDHNYTKTRNKT